MAMSAAQHPSGHAVTLWARDAVQAQSMRAQAQNARYLPGIGFPPSLSVADGDFRALVSGADLVIVATPMAALRCRHCMTAAARHPSPGFARASNRLPRRLDQRLLGCLPTKFKHR